MSEYWELINIDDQESTGNVGKMCGAPREGIFFTGSPEQMIKLVAVPVVPQEDIRSADGIRAVGSWAGCRLICIGDWIITWPKGIVTRSDFSWRDEDYTVPDSDFPWEDGDHVQNGPWETWEDVYSYFDSDRDIPGYSPLAFTKRCNHVFPDWRPMNNPFPNDRVWVLRNLSKKIFVRSNGVPSMNHHNDRWSYDSDRQGIDGYPGLGHVLVANIGWSVELSGSMDPSDNQLLRKLSQAWAGDRFDVRLFDDVEQDMATEGWVDETRKEAERLYHIWNKREGIKGGKFPEEPEQIFD